jgi:hypothetical protein
MNIAVIGRGNVGGALARLWERRVICQVAPQASTCSRGFHPMFHLGVMSAAPPLHTVTTWKKEGDTYDCSNPGHRGRAIPRV